MTTNHPSVHAEPAWRKGKPVEDPEKMKRWGWISAKPSEFLICMSGGKVTKSGQGATTFKWPWESVAIVPTTVQRLRFVADQVTAEKVGVQVTGIAVYRIADPLIAFRMLNFSYPERAQEKLSSMMEEMFIGGTRRLVANLTVEHCMTRRKDALSSELMREIGPVVGGVGRVEDRTARGWGVVVDNIEIQDVRVMSEAVFARMQARFRQELEQKAREAELSRERAIGQDEAASTRQIEMARVASATEIRRQRQNAEEAAQLEKLTADARVEETRLSQQLEAQRQKLSVEAELRAQKQASDERARTEQLAAEVRLAQSRAAAEEQAKRDALAAEAQLAIAQAEAEAARHQARIASEQQAADLLAAQGVVAEAKRALAETELKTVELELKKSELAAKLELERAVKLKEIENTVSSGVIQLAVANKLPELAAAFQQKMGEVHVTAVDGANPFGYVAAAVEGVMGLARSAGLDLKPKG
jgi:regulator of protease activity HflC (stomatin/prohibitin superfamily)